MADTNVLFLLNKIISSTLSTLNVIGVWCVEVSLYLIKF